MADSAFGGTYTPQTRQSQPSKSTLGSFKPGNPDSKPKVPLMVDSAFGDYNHLNRNVVAPQTQKMQPSTSTFGSFKPGNLNTELQQRRPIIEDSAFSGYNRLAGSTNSGSPQPSQSQHRLPSSTRSIVRQPNVPLNTTTTTFGEFKPPPPQGGSPQRAPDNIIEVEEEEEISQPSTSVPRPPKPIVSVIGNLLGDPNSPGALKGRAKAEIMRAKAKGPLPPTIQPKILPNGRKAGVFIDQEKKFRTTGVLQYFDAGCFNCGGGDHEGSVCKKGCYRCGKDHPLPQCPYNM
ncbi:hypothetical protein EAE99_001976 [Botrytis elliptica]|nr:hypothetical protein EAE99_001976 [Botrytis elliptica]